MGYWRAGGGPIVSQRLPASQITVSVQRRLAERRQRRRWPLGSRRGGAESAGYRAVTEERGKDGATRRLKG
jgi:hypothetical protein